MSEQTPAYLPSPAPQEPGAPIDSFAPQVASMPDRWHREAADIVLEVMASTEPHTQFDGLVKAVAHLISEHAEDLVALVNQIRLSQTEIDALRARLATEQRAAANAEREKRAAYEELRGVRAQIRPGIGMVADPEADSLLSATESVIRMAIRDHTPAAEIQSLLRQISEVELSAPPLPPGEEGKPALQGNAAGYEAIRQQLARRCATCGGKVNGHGECVRCEPGKVASHE